MTAFYNENDPYAAQWLRNLIAAGHIAPGVVDERSIVDVRPADLVGFTQCHFFAGLGGWSHALRLAGWPDDRPAWTGSAPCQPLSVAGQQKGDVDTRHLWPALHRLIAECKPSVVFGEQVAGKAGREWLAAVRSDLEGDGYACGAADLSAAGVGAPHIRQRLYWMAHAEHNGCDDSTFAGSIGESEDDRRMQQPEGCRATDARPDDGFWSGAVWLPCRDGKWRPTECGVFEIPDGLSDSLGYRRAGDQWSLDPLIAKTENRVGRLRGYGNALAAPLAKAFIEACIDVLPLQAAQPSTGAAAR